MLKTLVWLIIIWINEIKVLICLRGVTQWFFWKFCLKFIIIFVVQFVILLLKYSPSCCSICCYFFIKHSSRNFGRIVMQLLSMNDGSWWPGAIKNNNKTPKLNKVIMIFIIKVLHKSSVKWKSHCWLIILPFPKSCV